jgi:hypothetical protein
MAALKAAIEREKRRPPFVMARLMRAIQFQCSKLDGPDEPGHDE